MSTLTLRRFASSIATTAPQYLGKTRKINRIDKCPKGFFRDVNPLDREILLTGFKSPSGKRINFVRAEPKDFHVVAQFWGEEFTRTNNLCKHLGVTYEEFEQLASVTVNNCLKHGDVVMAFWGDRLVSTMLCLHYKESELPQLFDNELPGHPNPVFRIKNDYAEDIAAQPFCPKLNRCVALLDTVQRQTGKFLPAGVKKVGILEAVLVHPALHRERIGAVMLDLGDKQLVKYGVNDIIGTAVATYSSRICHKMGYKTLQKFYYKDYKEGGKPVFEDLNDEATYVAMIHRVIQP
uniref:N-acetyltransferase domain-containing protein n=1 Tax=Panagrellus redivivus TaxID=6233 RepID=A0A7E4UYH1_PANRE